MPDRIILFGPYRLRVNEDTGEFVIEGYDSASKAWKKILDLFALSAVGRTVDKILNVPVGTNNTFGSPVSYTATNAYIPYVVRWSTDGTFQSGETVTIELTETFDDGSTKVLTYTATGLTTWNVWPEDLLKFFTETGAYHGKKLRSLQFRAKSNLATTSVTVTAEITGWEV